MGIKVLSLFDGMSCLQIAMSKLGIKVDTYYASEIEEPAMIVTKNNYPDTLQIGDVTKITNQELLDLGKIDFLGGGSPCQNLSRIVINVEGHNQGLEGEKSKLFYEYLRVLTVTKPTFFLYENVGSMKQKDKDIITEELGVEPIMIDSNLVSAQDRERYYWTNIPNVQQPKDKNIKLESVLETDIKNPYYYDLAYDYYGDDKKVMARLHLYNYDMLQRVYNPKFKAPTLTVCKGGHKQKKVMVDGKIRRMTPLEYERLQTVPDNYTQGVADGHRYNMLGNGWTVDVIAHILSFMELDDTYEVSNEIEIHMQEEIEDQTRI